MKESVKIDADVVDRIRKHVKVTGQTISSYISITLNKDLDSMNIPFTLNEYATRMAPSLIDSANKTRKNKRK